MHDVFYVLLLEQNTTRIDQMDKWVTELKLKVGNNEEYKIEAIWNNAVYASKSESGQLPGLYYLVAYKGYREEKYTWEPLSMVQHLKKLISCFYKEHPEKPTATFPPINSAPPMARPTVKSIRPTTKRKRSRPANNANKQAKNWVLDIYNI